MEYIGRLILSEPLQEWYKTNARNLPWRHTNDAYSIWLSEVILQQTRVAQGLPYYLRFLEAFPNVGSLARASQDQVLKLWQGLGYYSRARNLLLAAIQIDAQANGQMPSSSVELMKIKGIGPYTAAAVASFAFGERVAVADGNVYRVLTRVFAISNDIATQTTQNALRTLATQILPAQDEQVATHNQAMMELGALVCTPKKPSCHACPLQPDCQAFTQRRVEEYPFKSRKKEKKIRYFNYVILVSSGQIAMARRPEGDIWQGLYHFWLSEQNSQKDFDNFGLDNINFGTDGLEAIKPSSEFVLISASQPYRHQLTHQSLFVRFYKLEISAQSLGFSDLPAGYTFYSLEQIEKLPKPILIKKYLESLEFFSIFSTDL